MILIFMFFTTKYYFSDKNIKKSHRSLLNLNTKIIKYSQNLIILKDDTKNIIEYVKNDQTKNRSILDELDEVKNRISILENIKKSSDITHICTISNGDIKLAKTDYLPVNNDVLILLIEDKNSHILEKFINDY